MNSKYKTILWAFCASLLLLISCSEDDETRRVYPHSTPVIEYANINPSSFAYGDSVMITAKLSDPLTPLSTLKVNLIVNDVLIAEQTFRTEGNSTEISQKLKVRYTSQLPDNASIEVQLVLTNIEGDITKGSIDGIIGHRKYYNKLYLVLDNGTIYTLNPSLNGVDKYSSEQLMIKNNSIRYKIAEKIDSENQIDFSGDVWGYIGGSFQLIDETGDYLTTTNSSIDYITEIAFDSYNFETSLVGSKLNPNDLTLDNFEDVTVKEEDFQKLTRTFEANQTMTLFDELTSMDIVYNLDYFKRISDDQVQFIGEQGTYTLYYSATRKTVIVDPALRSFPDILLVAGEGLGYPSKVKEEAHTSWDFNAPLDAIIFRKTASNIYQGTVYIDTQKANFKPFENRDWGNEKKSTDFSMPAIIAKDTDLGKSDGNWYSFPDATAGNYKITIDLSTNTVTAENVTLP